MPTSADRRHDRPRRGGARRPRDVRRGRRAAAGFTLLEVMVTLALVVMTIVPMLVERDKAWNMALRTANLMKAATYADQVLAEHLLDPDDRKEWPGVIEDDPLFRYELTIETYDLSTGRVESEGDGSDETGFSTTSAFAPPDALEDPSAGSDEDPDDPHRVRRYHVLVRFPGYGDEEGDEEYVLEGYAPVPLEPLPPGGTR